ncbi:PepSY-like domain-containing protein [Christiangramia echinicola]|uniref:Beta-lactamase-inhibitor-like, PepSY-like n=1 Tax=Christiangramia echinicola TaxID=279359 RepID=A0A1H1RXE4_9FLAO|nr:PepSY-like domain-containing protein [Christiangramia echinicola]SDS39659.1 Putative beta-lactamase-inhibitor-like, PepSY-like [Christiangramia echinicola]
MRKISIFIAGCLTVGLLSCQEKNDKKEDAPEAVKMAFQTKYPGENDPDWEQDEHGYWESHFKQDGEKYRADFNADGTWVETENDIKKKNLPDAIKKVIEEQYSDYEITEVEHVQSAKKGEFYDVEFKQKGKNKDVMFREDGSIIE